MGAAAVPLLRLISLGAGVQSTTAALMAAHGEIGPMPDAGIFADTYDEGADTYEHLDWLITALPFPIYRVSRGCLSKALFDGDDQARIPAFVKGSGRAKLQCTRNFKIRPLRREYRELLGRPGRAYVPPGAIEQWIGISKDEADRIKPSGARFIVNRYPLIEKGMTRSHCTQWLLRNRYPVPPKSACIYCAFQSDEQWLGRPRSDFQRACSIDRRLRSPENIARFRGELYLHRSCQPLDEINFAALVAARNRQGDLFANECDGVCGV